MEVINQNKAKWVKGFLTFLILVISGTVLGQKRLYFDENGIKSTQEDAVYYKDIEKSGDKFRVKEYYASNDQLKLSGTYLDSDAADEERDGKFITYYENGQIHYEVRFSAGKEKGEYMSYHPNGKIKAKGEFAGGEENGEWEYYHDNGQLHGKGLLFSGGFNGDWVWFFPDGKKEKEGRFKNGVKDGKYITYFDTGTLKQVSVYNNDKLSGFSTIYWETGKVAEEGNYYNNLKDSVWMWYHENGVQSCKAFFERGEFSHGFFYNEQGEELDKRASKENLVKLPEYPGGIEKFYDVVADRLKSDEEIDLKTARKYRFNKPLLFEVYLDKQGKVSSTKMVSPDESLPYSDPFKIIEAIKNTVTEIPDLTPMRAYNRYTESVITIQITYDAVLDNVVIATKGLRK